MGNGAFAVLCVRLRFYAAGLWFGATYIRCIHTRLAHVDCTRALRRRIMLVRPRPLSPRARACDVMAFCKKGEEVEVKVEKEDEHAVGIERFASMPPCSSISASFAVLAESSIKQGTPSQDCTRLLACSHKTSIIISTCYRLRGATRTSDVAHRFRQSM